VEVLKQYFLGLLFNGRSVFQALGFKMRSSIAYLNKCYWEGDAKAISFSSREGRISVLF